MPEWNKKPPTWFERKVYVILLELGLYSLASRLVGNVCCGDI